MNEFKTLWNAYRAAEKEMNKIDKAYELDPESAELETKWDAAYKAEYNAKEQVVEKIIELTAGQIDRKTANMMILTRKNDLESIIEKIA